MTKTEIEAKKIASSATKFTEVCGVIKTTLFYATILGCVYLIFTSLEKIVIADAKSIEAVGGIITALRLDVIVAYMVGAATTLGWYYERVGKKRAIRLLSEQREYKEGSDPYHGSSGLNKDGDTPRTT